MFREGEDWETGHTCFTSTSSPYFVLNDLGLLPDRIVFL